MLWTSTGAEACGAGPTAVEAGADGVGTSGRSEGSTASTAAGSASSSSSASRTASANPARVAASREETA